MRLVATLALLAAALAPSASGQFVPGDEFYHTGGAYNGQWGLHDMRMEEAWAITTGSDDVVVAVIDTRAWLDHPDLQASLWDDPDYDPGNSLDHGAYFGDGPNLSSPGVPAGSSITHGTSVASIILAQTAGPPQTAGTGMAGVAGGRPGSPSPRWMVLGVQSGGPQAPDYLAAAIDYAVEHGADVINVSIGSCYNQFADEVANAHAEGVVIVASSGNQSEGSGAICQPNQVKYPAAYPETIAVGAALESGARWPLSQPNIHPNLGQGTYPYLMAPGGEDITAADPTGYTFEFGGTSAAAPHVTGVVALIQSLYPRDGGGVLPRQRRSGPGPAEIAAILTQTADPAGCIEVDPALTRSQECGSGRVDAYSALKYAIETYGGTFAGDLVIPAGETWNLGAVTLAFAPATKLIVKGTLNAASTTFTASNTTSGWDGIRFEPGSRGLIEDGVVEYAKTRYYNPAYGIAITNASPTIRRVELTNNSTAIYVTGPSGLPRLEVNQIYSNGQGILLANRGRADMRGNVIENNSGDAVSGGYLTALYLYENTIGPNGGWGVEAMSGSMPTFARYYSSSNGFNVLSGNGAGGIGASGGASVRAGSLWYQNTNSLLQNGNSQHASEWVDDIGPDAYVIHSGTAVYAQNNWWGRPTAPDTTTCSFSYGCPAYTGTLYVEPMLQNAPSGTGSPAPAPFAAPKSAGRGSGPWDGTPREQAQRRLLAARAAGTPAEALAHLQAVVGVAPDHRLAAVALMEAARLGRPADGEAGPPGLAGFLAASARAPGARRQAWARRALVAYHHLRGEGPAALAHATALARTDGADEARWFGHEARVYLLAEAGRLAEASAALADLEVAAPEWPGAAHARRYLAFVGGLPPTVGARSKGALSGEAIVTGYTLGAAFPNPAGGAETAVPFALGAAGTARVTVFDALGREVAVIADGRFGEGPHRARLPTADLPAGAYLVRATFETADGRRIVRARVLTVLR